MFGNKFSNDLIVFTEKLNHEYCLIHHAAKLLISKYDESRRLLEESGLIDLRLFEKLIDERLQSLPKNSGLTPTHSSTIHNILQGAIVSAGSSILVTELHILTETITSIIDGDAAYMLEKACEDPMELKSYVSILLTGGVIKCPEREQNEIDSHSPKSAYLKQGYVELAAKLKDEFIGDRSDVDKLKSAANKHGGAVIALVGERRSGKTSIIDAFNYWLVSSDEPKAKNDIVYLDVDMMLKGAINRGAFEHYITNALYDCQVSNSILLVENIHYINDACRDPDIMPLLSRAADLGVITVCTVTPEAYSKVFEKRGYEGAVQRINVTSPTPDTRAKILKHIANNLSNEAQVVYQDSALDELNRLADIHFSSTLLRDSIEVLERCTTVHDRDLITSEVVQSAVASVKGIPLDILTSGLAEKLRNLQGNIKKSLFGQDEAVSKICEQIQLSSLGFKVKDKQPRCSFMMLGASGVGKTETTELIGKELGTGSLILNMGEFQESHTISKLLGAPPGYLGHDKGDGLLAEFVAKNPNGIIVFDEIEKATSKIFDLLLGVLDKGSLTTNTQKEVDFSGNIIFFTSNCGVDTAEGASFGILGEKSTKNTIDHDVFEQTFRPEFRNRLTAIIDYKTLDEEDVILVARKSINKIFDRVIKQYGINVSVSEEAIKFICTHYYCHEMGARPIERGVEKEIGCRLGSILLTASKIPKSIQFHLEYDEVQVTVN